MGKKKKGRVMTINFLAIIVGMEITMNNTSDWRKIMASLMYFYYFKIDQQHFTINNLSSNLTDPIDSNSKEKAKKE